MNIVFLACPRVQMLDIIGPADIFAEAARQLGKPRSYQVIVLGTEHGMIKGTNGLRLALDGTISTFKGKIDTLLIAGSPAISEIAKDQQLQDWLQLQATKVRRLGSVCTGAFLLAAAGLLDGRRVTTHWNSSVLLAKDYPDTIVESDSIFIRDGNIYTSAGVTAGMDLALAMVEEDHGRDLALCIAREMVMYFKRSGGQSQFSARLAAQTAERTVICQIQSYIMENLKAELTIPLLAKRAGMSERNFARVFKSESGLTPAEFVELTRIDEARRLIEAGRISLKKLANQIGYANVDGFRRAFVRRLGLNPREYQKRFYDF
ncbi:DJ-1/PfpI family protein [Neisseriaceae bacterium TC5R-5]|nr:DJ-1/PfpI family protein [Neisseriaceae bacterium TC5R-5]